MDALFFCVLKNVEASLAEICILSSVVNGVIVVPQSSCILSIWVAIILVLIDASGVFCPAIERSARYGMDRQLSQRSMVGSAYRTIHEDEPSSHGLRG